MVVVEVEVEPDPCSVNEITDELMPVLLTIDISEEAGEFFCNLFICIGHQQCFGYMEK